MESTKLPWIQQQKSMAFHELPQFFVVGLLAIVTAMETLKTTSEYSVDFNRGFQGFSMAILKTGMMIP